MRWLLKSIALVCCAGCQDLPKTEQAVQPDDDVTRAYQVKVENDKAFLARMLEEERRTLDARIGDRSSRCYLHHIRLQEGIVPLAFGFPVWPEDYIKAWATLFPRAELFHQTCVVSEHRYARVTYCRVCRSVESQWASGLRGDKIKIPTPDELAREVAKENEEYEAAQFR